MPSQAERLKRIGFDYPCDAYYTETGKLSITGSRNNFNYDVVHFTNAPYVF